MIIAKGHPLLLREISPVNYTCLVGKVLVELSVRGSGRVKLLLNLSVKIRFIANRLSEIDTSSIAQVKSRLVSAHHFV